MFRRSSEPLALSEASLLALRPSMNAPVLNVDFLPIGPARAAIVVFAEEYGDIGLAIGVRSEEGGQIAVFTIQEPLDASTPIADALEPALSTAERMGFLFDEDLIEGASGGSGRSRAMAHWGDLMGALDDLESLDDEMDDGELLLDDIADVDLTEEISLDLEDELDPVAPESTLPPVAVVPSKGGKAASGATPKLSKFRNAPSGQAERTAVEAAEPPADATPGGSELGRIPLVRVRREGSRKVPYLARLLSSF